MLAHNIQRLTKKLEKQTEIEDTSKEQKRETLEDKKKAQQPRGTKLIRYDEKEINIGSIFVITEGKRTEIQSSE